MAADVRQQTGCWVYAVVRGADRPAMDAVGIDDAPLRLLVHGAVAAVVADVAVDRPPGRRADLMAYSRVVDDLLAGGVVVPVQFGSLMPDEASVVEDFLAPNEGHFTELLDQLEGRSQFTVRATYVTDTVLREVVATDPAVAELRARTKGQPEEAVYGDLVRLGELVAQEMEAKRDVDAETVCDAVAPLTVAVNVTAGSGLEAVVDLTCLVDDDRRADFEDRLEDLAEILHERIHLSLVGPVAPYDFVEGAPWG
nr:GvpL/GvpF family gas vesicle protein [Nocardioides sp. JQ2195]